MRFDDPAMDHLANAIKELEDANQHLTGRNFTEKEGRDMRDEATTVQNRVTHFLNNLDWRISKP